MLSLSGSSVVQKWAVVSCKGHAIQITLHYVPSLLPRVRNTMAVIAPGALRLGLYAHAHTRSTTPSILATAHGEQRAIVFCFICRLKLRQWDLGREQWGLGEWHFACHAATALSSSSPNARPWPPRDAAWSEHRLCIEAVQPAVVLVLVIRQSVMNILAT